ncbi:hypothetical protein HDK64DRAFT_267660 [Phyllosticta capitalensis]
MWLIKKAANLKASMPSTLALGLAVLTTNVWPSFFSFNVALTGNLGKSFSVLVLSLSLMVLDWMRPRPIWARPPTPVQPMALRPLCVSPLTVLMLRLLAMAVSVWLLSSVEPGGNGDVLLAGGGCCCCAGGGCWGGGACRRTDCTRPW